MEEELHPARYRDTATEGGPKAPVAGRLDRGAVEEWRAPMHEPYARDVSFTVDLDVHCDIAARGDGSSCLRVRRLLLLHYPRWLDCGWSGLLSMDDGLRRNQGAEPEQKEGNAEWEHEISSTNQKTGTPR